MGNRGILHDAQQRIVTPRWKTALWIICTTDVLPGWQPRKPMTPGTYTELFFMDELTALAAGHRPCALCRHTAWNQYRAALKATEARQDLPMAPEINTRLKNEMRLYLQRHKPQPRPTVRVKDLPDGAFYSSAGVAYVKWQGAARAWSFSGYGPPEHLVGHAQRLTPALNCDALRGGYAAQAHPTLHHSGVNPPGV